MFQEKESIMKIGFVYSGQGAQYIGMGQDLAETFPAARKVFDLASNALNMDLTELCFKENDLLNETTYTQPAILTVSMAIDAVLAEAGIFPEAVGGLSLGEYTAFVKANVLDFHDAVSLVKQRGKFMTEAVPSGEGAMSAVLGLERETVEQVCLETSEYGIVAPANYNMPGQIAIAGKKEAVEAAGEKMLEKGAKRVVPLKVSGPFHTSLLKPAADQLEQVLKSVQINDPTIPVVSNTTAEWFKNKEDIRKLMVQQVQSPVYWEDAVKTMIQSGVDTFIEVGPGKTLSAFIKKIDRSVTTLNVEHQKSLDKTLKKLNEKKLPIH